MPISQGSHELIHEKDLKQDLTCRMCYYYFLNSLFLHCEYCVNGQLKTSLVSRALESFISEESVVDAIDDSFHVILEFRALLLVTYKYPTWLWLYNGPHFWAGGFRTCHWYLSPGCPRRQGRTPHTPMPAHR